MLKLDIFNVEGFLEAVNECSGKVSLVSGNGKSEDAKSEDVQCRLRRSYRQDGERLRLELDVPEGRDYLRLVFFSLGNF